MTLKLIQHKVSFKMVLSSLMVPIIDDADGLLDGLQFLRKKSVTSSLIACKDVIFIVVNNVPFPLNIFYLPYGPHIYGVPENF